MKLTNKDRKLLIKWGHDEKDFNQIEEATRKTVYEMNGKRIPRKKALEVLGKEEYLSGISRSAFHQSAVRNNNDKIIYFDSSKLFK